MMIKKVVSDEYGQAGLDYILGITIFLGAMITIFYIMTNIISPISAESNELDYVAISVSEYLLANFSEGGLNVVNVTNLSNFLSKNYSDVKESLGIERYEFNITLKDLFGNTLLVSGKELPQSDTGYVKRLISDSRSPNRYFIEVVVWK